MHDSYIQNGASGNFQASRLNSKFLNKIWDDSGEGVPGTNVFSSGKGLRPFLIFRFVKIGQKRLQHFCCSNWADFSTGGLLTPQQQ